MHSLAWPLGDRKLRKEDKMQLKKQKLEKRENFYFADFEEEGRATIHVISRSWEIESPPASWESTSLLTPWFWFSDTYFDVLGCITVR